MNIQSENNRASLYCHLGNNGTIFIIADDVSAGAWVDATRFKAELQRIKEALGFLVMSWDDDVTEEDSPQKLLEDLVRSYEVEVRVAKHRHPAVVGYSRSFAIALWDAVDLAKHDIDGTKGKLEHAEYWVGQAKQGTSDYSFWTEQKEMFIKQLAYAEMAYSKLNDLELELTRDPDGGEN